MEVGRSTNFLTQTNHAPGDPFYTPSNLPLCGGYNKCVALSTPDVLLLCYWHAHAWGMIVKWFYDPVDIVNQLPLIITDFYFVYDSIIHYLIITRKSSTLFHLSFVNFAQLTIWHVNVIKFQVLSPAPSFSNDICVRRRSAIRTINQLID